MFKGKPNALKHEILNNVYELVGVNAAAGVAATVAVGFFSIRSFFRSPRYDVTLFSGLVVLNVNGNVSYFVRSFAGSFMMTNARTFSFGF